MEASKIKKMFVRVDTRKPACIAAEDRKGGRSLPTCRISIECKELSVVSGTLHGADGLIRVYRTREYRSRIKIYTTVSENENRSCKNINRFVSVTVKQKLYIDSNSEIATFFYD